MWLSSVTRLKRSYISVVLILQDAGQISDAKTGGLFNVSKSYTPR